MQDREEVARVGDEGLVLQVLDYPDIRVITYFADADGDLDDVEFDA